VHLRVWTLTPISSGGIIATNVSLTLAIMWKNTRFVRCSLWCLRWRNKSEGNTHLYVTEPLHTLHTNTLRIDYPLGIPSTIQFRILCLPIYLKT
jgi:hypothetical protein